MSLNLDVFQEPRGVMRIIQFFFAIWAFAKTVDYTNELTLDYCGVNTTRFEFGYPYRLDRIHATLSCLKTKDVKFSLVGDFSSDAEFFVATGVLSMLYCMGISVLYVMFNDLYKSNAMIPIADFLLSLLLAVFWLSGSAAWANGLMGLKAAVGSVTSFKACSEIHCDASEIGSFSGLNISIALGFLNFFLWAFDLWFLYKETQWFNDPNKTTSSNIGVSAA